MSVFRVKKNENYTVMSNYHLRDMNLSLKAKGLLSLMLSLTEDWDYTLKGLALICKEGVAAIRTAVNELEEHHYLVREQVRNDNGQFADNNYIVYEVPMLDHNNPICDSASSNYPICENPTTENPMTEKPMLENRTQINKDIINIDIQSKDINNTEIYQEIYPSYQSYYGTSVPISMGTSISKDEIDRCKSKVQENIDYEYLCNHWSPSYIDGIVDIINSVMCSRKRDTYISGQAISTIKVREQLSRLDSRHIDYVAECMKNNSSEIRNIRAYLLTSLYNAPETIEPYYENKVNSSMRMIA